MEIFEENHFFQNSSYKQCDSCEAIQYLACNFHNFAALLVLLWNIMVVNNWHIFLEALSCTTSKWSQVYFGAWWLVSVVVTVNLFVSLVIEIFLKWWEDYNSVKKKHSGSGERVGEFPGTADSMMLASTQSIGEFTHGLKAVTFG